MPSLPLALIFKCLEQISMEKANIVLVCPVWPTKPWFPVLLELVCDLLPEADVISPGPTAQDFPPSFVDGIARDSPLSFVDGIAPARRLEIIQESFRLQGLSKLLVNILLAGNRPATRTSYVSAWRNWADWCF